LGDGSLRPSDRKGVVNGEEIHSYICIVYTLTATQNGWSFHPQRNFSQSSFQRIQTDFRPAGSRRFETVRSSPETWGRDQICLFHNTAMASVLNLMEDGKSIEVGLVGKEGFVGLPSVAGFRTSPHRVITQGGGNAFRIGAKELRGALGARPLLGTALLRYSQRLILQTTQIAACKRLHEGDERLARWLLMTHDRIGRAELPLTQEFLAQMLGSRRASVSTSAITLQKAGLISYVHGKVEILNRKGLEKASCECYETM
jgi:CRP-like cAMP-binding protein